MTPEEVAAVTAVAVALRQREEEAAAAGAGAGVAGNAQLNAWVDASRRSAQRALMQRGPWRLSSRIGRRSRT